MKSFALEQLANHHNATGSIVHRYVTESDYQNLAAQYQFLRNAVVAHVSGTDRPFELLKALDMSPEQCMADIQAEAGRTGFIAGAQYANKRPDVVLPTVIEMVAWDYAERVKDGEK
jgi:shikimate 5-dehydrogenase